MMFDMTRQLFRSIVLLRCLFSFSFIFFPIEVDQIGLIHVVNMNKSN